MTLKVLTILGTRPEAIKLAPLIQKLGQDPYFDSKVISTAQHREMLDPVFEIFKIIPNYDLALMSPHQTLCQIAGRVFEKLDPILAEEKPDCVIVQGDTTTAFAAGVAAFYHRAKIAHVEAGLRTFSARDPFPEELNRRILSVTADFHFAPTERAKKNLLSEGIRPESVFVTQNTVVDALLQMTAGQSVQPSVLDSIDFKKRVLLVTLHRRENWGEPMRSMTKAIVDIANTYPDVEILWPLHLNPAVQEVVKPLVKNLPRVHLIAPLDYFDFVYALKHCCLVLTDSGGIQEEAPSLGKPVLVLRNTTERHEGIEAGVSFLVGTDTRAIREMAARFLSDTPFYNAVAERENPYGDGRASERIIKILKEQFQ